VRRCPTQGAPPSAAAPHRHLDDGLLTASEVAQLKLNADWVVLSSQEQVDEGKRIVSRCLLPDEREKAFLEREPPQWCLEMEKWPYQEWQTWRKVVVCRSKA
jgi:hypothetical protein